MPPLSYFVRVAIATLSPLAVGLTMGLPGWALQYNPPNRGAPANTRDAGSRTGPCGNLTALQPSQTNWGETLRAHPTFGIYVSEPAKNLTFELINERSKEIVHQATFSEMNGPGISLYTLPETVPALEPGQYYRWQISVDCAQFNTDNIQYTGNKQADGMIMRRGDSSELQTTLATTPEAEKPALLAANGLWYDMVHALLMQQADGSNPVSEAADPTESQADSWTQAWHTLLTHPMVQLQQLMDAPLVESCLTASESTASHLTNTAPTQ